MNASLDSRETDRSTGFWSIAGENRDGGPPPRRDGEITFHAVKFETEIGSRLEIRSSELPESGNSVVYPQLSPLGWQVFSPLWCYAPRSAGPNIGQRRQARQAAALLSTIGTRRDTISSLCPAIMSLSSKESFLLVSCLLTTTMLAVTCAKPTIYKRNQDNVFEPGEAFAFSLGCCSHPQFAESFRKEQSITLETRC